MSDPPPSTTPEGQLVRMEYIDEDATTPMPRRKRMPPVLHANLQQIAQMPPPEDVRPPRLDFRQTSFQVGRFDTTVRMARTIVRQALKARVPIPIVARMTAFMGLAVVCGLIAALIYRQRELRIQRAAHPPVPEETTR